MDNFVKQAPAQRQMLVKQYKDLQKMNAQIKKEIEIFQSKLTNLKNEYKDEELLIEQERINREFLAIKNVEGFNLIDLGDMCKESKNYSEAIAYYTQAIEKIPDFSFEDQTIVEEDPRPLTYNARAEAYMEIGEYDKAIADCDKGMEIAKENPKDLFILGVTRKNVLDAIEKKRFDDEWKNIDQNDAASLITRAGEYFKRIFKDKNYINLAVEDCMKAISIDPEILVKNEKTIITYIFFLEDYESQVNYLNKLIELNPNSSALHNNRGLAYEQLGNTEKALADYYKSFKLDPKNELARKNYMRMQDPDKFEQLTNLFEQARSFRKNKNYSDALATYNKIIELESNNLQAYFERSVVHFSLERYEMAVTDYNKFIELESDPNDDSAVYFNRGNCYFNLGDYDSAIKDYTKYLELNPNLEEYEMAGVKFLKSAEDLRSNLVKFSNLILELDTSTSLYRDSVAYYNRGNCYFNLGDYDSAIRDYTKYLELNLEDEEAYYQRGLAYEKIGELEKSKADFKKSEELGYKD